MAGSCELESGECVPESQLKDGTLDLKTADRVEVLLFTDPICSHCWAMEPSWRKFLFHYGNELRWRLIYGGLLPGWEGFADEGSGIRKPVDVYPHWQEIADRSGQPIDPSVWLNDPISSSYPSSEAAHVIRLMKPDKEDLFLRKVRHSVFLEAKNIAKVSVLAECASQVGVDQNDFIRLFESGAGKPGFQRDLEETARFRVRGFPTLVILSSNQPGMSLVGAKSFAQIESAFLKVSGLEPKRKNVDLKSVLEFYQIGTTREFSEVLEFSHEETILALGENQRQKIERAGDALWE
jgi:predicted DsbA family dithiol-disulfide isomerase